MQDWLRQQAISIDAEIVEKGNLDAVLTEDGKISLSFSQKTENDLAVKTEIGAGSDLTYKVSVDDPTTYTGQTATYAITGKFVTTLAYGATAETALTLTANAAEKATDMEYTWDVTVDADEILGAFASLAVTKAGGQSYTEAVEAFNAAAQAATYQIVFEVSVASIA